MSDQDAVTEPGAGETPPPPQMRILRQYIKDLSFENPNAPMSIAQAQEEQPALEVGVEVHVQRFTDNEYESQLRLTVGAKQGENPAFIAELLYCGIVQVSNVPDEAIQAVLLVEAPRQLFPFARRIIADMTRDGGYPPLMLEPIDFAALFQQQMYKRVEDEEEAAEASA